MRLAGDLLADQVIEATFQHGNIDLVNQLIRKIVENDDLVPEELPDEIEFFLRDHTTLPGGADAEKIREGQQLFFRYGVKIISLLLCKSLPYCYAGADGAQVLYFSQRINNQTHRRIVETSQFVMDVMSPGAFEANQRGIRSCQKVRLMHAAVRYHLKKGNRWNYAWGVPINQEDMIGTNLAFSALILRGLKQLNIDFTEREEESYLHTWNVIGFMMGIREDLLPATMQEADELGDAIALRNHKPSEAGTELTRALLSFIKDQVIPGKMFDSFADTYIRFLAGDTVADMLGVEKSTWTKAFLAPMRWLNYLTDEMGDQSALFAKITAKFNENLIRGMQKIDRTHKNVHFRIPKDLDDEWAKGYEK